MILNFLSDSHITWQITIQKLNRWFCHWYGYTVSGSRPNGGKLFYQLKPNQKKRARLVSYCSICHSFHRAPRQKQSNETQQEKPNEPFSSRNFIIRGSIKTYQRAFRLVFGNAKKKSAMCRCVHRQVPRMIRKKSKIQPEQSKWTYKICSLVPFKFSPVQRWPRSAFRIGWKVDAVHSTFFLPIVPANKQLSIDFCMGFEVWLIIF